MAPMTHYTEGLSQLGAQTAAPTSPEEAVLERVLGAWEGMMVE